MLKDLNLNDLSSILEVLFYDVDGNITLVMKNPTAIGLLEEILRRTDEHDLIHVERVDNHIEISDYDEDFDSHYD